MATTYLFKDTSAGEPTPNAMVDSQSYEDSYVAAKTALTTANSGTAAIFAKSYGLATDSVLHYIQGTQFMTPALATQSIASQNWSIKLWGLYTPAPSIARVYMYVYLFIWDGVNDTLRTGIGQANVEITAAALTAYTCTITGAANITAGDKLGVDFYYVVDDDPSETAGLITMRLRYGGSVTTVNRDSGLTSPATITELGGSSAPTRTTLNFGV